MSGPFTPGQVLTAAQLNAAIPTSIATATSPDAGVLTGAEEITASRGTGVLQTALTTIARWVIQTYQGFTQSGAGAVARTVQDKQREQVSGADYGVIGDGTTFNSAALQQLINSFGSNVDIHLGPGTFLFDPHYTVPVAGQGTAVNFGSSTANITIRGSGIGKTIIKPTTNAVEIFSVNGTNIEFTDLTFDNSANGVLQNTLKPATITPNGGVAGLGNQANAAITQYAGGGGLTIRRCQFLAFNLGVHYYGNYANIAQLVGELYIEEMKINGCCFGALVEQPNSWWMINSESQNTQNSLNAAGSDTTVDPGHLLYVTDRPGAVPILGTISNVQGTNDLAEVVKVRKGLSVNASGINVQGSNRGAAFYQLNGLVLTGYEATITQLDMTDTQISGLEITDCAQAVVIAPRINIVGAQAYGLRLRVDLAPTNAKNCRIVNPTVIGDWTLNTSSPFRIENYVDTVIEDPLFMHVGSNAGAGHWPVEVVSGTRVSVLRPRHYLVGGGTAPADAAFVVSFDSASTNCLVDINASALSPGVVYSGANTVHDSGVSSQLIGPYFGGFYGSNGAITAGSSLSGMSITAGGAVVIASSAVAMAKQKLSADGVIERWYGPAGTVIGNVTTSGTSLRLSLDQANTVFFSTGNGSPAGSVTAGVGSIYVNRGGTAGSILWVKQSATDATGWTAIA